MNSYALKGTIASAGFASGHRIVVGSWSEGPLGPMNDVMWARPDGTRVLIAPTQQVADFVDTIYGFDKVLVEPVEVERYNERFAVRCASLQMILMGGRKFPIPLARLRPPLVTRYIEGPIARRLMKVTTYGKTDSGIREWYRADQLQLVKAGSATVAGVDAGELTHIDPPMRVGVSEPPKFASIVKVRPLLMDVDGHLDKVFAAKY